jgi:cell division GTPase FtsZ
MIKNSIEEKEKQSIIDDLDLDSEKLAMLKNKLKKKEKSINLGFIGSGQGGSKLVSVFHKLGYDSVCMNTAQQDLKFIEMPEQNKLLLNYGLGGAAKDLSIGQQAAESNLEQIKTLLTKLDQSHVNVLCFSLGGGSGAGSSFTIIDALAELGKPIVVMTILPMESDDVQTKSNSLETLSKLTKLVQQKKIANLIVVDNAKIEVLLQNTSQLDFFNVANKTIANPIDVFNTLSSLPSSVKPLDPTEWARILIDGEGLSIYGELTIDDYEQPTSIAEAVISNLTSNMLAEGFDIKDAKYVGVIIAGNKKVMDKIPASSVNYAMAIINEQCSNPTGIFKGIYTIDSDEDNIKVYSFFSGLSLPESRVSSLKKEVNTQMQKVKEKEERRALNLNLDIGKEQNVSAAKKIQEQIAKNNSAFGKLVGNVVDRRNK